MEHEFRTALIGQEDLPRYQVDMQEAFLLGAQVGGCLDDGGLILPEADIDRSFFMPGATAFEAVKDGWVIGGAIVVLELGAQWRQA